MPPVQSFYSLSTNGTLYHANFYVTTLSANSSITITTGIGIPTLYFWICSQGGSAGASAAANGGGSGNIFFGGTGGSGALASGYASLDPTQANTSSLTCDSNNNLTYTQPFYGVLQVTAGGNGQTATPFVSGSFGAGGASYGNFPSANYTAGQPGTSFATSVGANTAPLPAGIGFLAKLYTELTIYHRQYRLR